LVGTPIWAGEGEGGADQGISVSGWQMTDRTNIRRTYKLLVARLGPPIPWFRTPFRRKRLRFAEERDRSAPLCRPVQPKV